MQNVCNNKLKSAKSTFQRRLLDQNSLNPRKFQQVIKKILPFRKSVTTSDGNTSDKVTLRNQVESFSEYFATAVNKLKERSIKLMDFIWNYPKKLAARSSHDFKIQNVSNAFVLRELRKLKRNKACGIDDLPPGMLTDCREHIYQPLCHVINLAIWTNRVPTVWKIAKVIPIHKARFRRRTFHALNLIQ